MDGFLRHVLLDGGPADRALAPIDIQAVVAEQARARRDPAADQAPEDNVAAGRHASEYVPGRLGPRAVRLDLASSGGEIVLSPMSVLEIESARNFGSCRANVCLFTGKWMYEATVITTGVQQIGWCTYNCPFVQDRGVGDDEQSFAYDGKRSCKWNKDPKSYGQAWVSGDVIGCLLDLDNDTITFCHNGKSMGVAYDNIRTGWSGMALFPALSLSQGEKCQLNFGATGFKYPVDGYRAVDIAPSNVAAAQYLVGCVDRLVPYFQQTATPVPLPPTLANGVAPDAASDGVLTLCAYHVIALLVELLRHAEDVDTRIVHDVIVPAVVRHHLNGSLAAFIDVLFEHMEDHERKTLTNAVMYDLAESCRVLPFCDLHELSSGAVLRRPALPVVTITAALDVITAMLSLPAVVHSWHDPSPMRFNLIVESFFFLKSPNAEDLKLIFAKTFWDDAHAARGECATGDEVDAQLAQMSKLLRALEQQHERLASVLSNIAIYGKKPGTAFALWLRKLLHKNRVVTRSQAQNGEASSPSILINVYFATLRLLRPSANATGSWTYDAEVFGAVDFASTTDANAAEQTGTPCTLPFYDFGRLGGTPSHLRRELREQGQLAAPNADVPEGALPLQMIDARLLLLDSALLLHYYAVLPGLHAAAQTTQTRDALVSRLRELDELLRAATSNDPTREQARTVLVNNLQDAVRTSYWNSLRMYHEQNLANMCHLLFALAEVLHATSKHAYFGFVPEYYLEVLVHLVQTLVRHQPQDSFLFLFAFQRAITFLATHLFDKRIVTPEAREMALNSITTMMQEAALVQLLEINVELNKHLMADVVKHYDDRNWISVVKIIMRANMDCSWGRLAEVKMVVRDRIIDVSLERDAAAGSETLMQRFGSALRENREQARRFVNRVFNHLNWALTEYAVAINNVLERPAGVALAQAMSRFVLLGDLTMALLRTMEATCQCCPELFHDDDTDVMFPRLAQLVMSTLSRFTTGTNSKTFTTMLDQYGIPNYRYGVLAPVFGIIDALMRSSAADAAGVKRAAHVFAHEGAIAEEAVAFVLGSTFDFGKYKSVSADEVALTQAQLSEISAQLEARKAQAMQTPADLDSDYLCPICYADAVSTEFVPCGHQSCKHCIQRQLIDTDVCFFCKAKIDALKSLETGAVAALTKRAAA